MVWKQDAFRHPWVDLDAYAFPPLLLLRVMISTNLSLVLVDPLWPPEEGFADLLALLVEPL